MIDNSHNDMAMVFSDIHLKSAFKCFVVLFIMQQKDSTHLQKELQKSKDKNIEYETEVVSLGTYYKDTISVYLAVKLIVISLVHEYPITSNLLFWLSNDIRSFSLQINKISTSLTSYISFVL